MKGSVSLAPWGKSFVKWRTQKNKIQKLTSFSNGTSFAAFSKTLMLFRTSKKENCLIEHDETTAIGKKCTFFCFSNNVKNVSGGIWSNLQASNKFLSIPHLCVVQPRVQVSSRSQAFVSKFLGLQAVVSPVFGSSWLANQHFVGVLEFFNRKKHSKPFFHRGF